MRNPCQCHVATTGPSSLLFPAQATANTLSPRKLSKWGYSFPLSQYLLKSKNTAFLKLLIPVLFFKAPRLSNLRKEASLFPFLSTLPFSFKNKAFLQESRASQGCTHPQLQICPATTHNTQTSSYQNSHLRPQSLILLMESLSVLKEGENEDRVKGIEYHQHLSLVLFKWWKSKSKFCPLHPDDLPRTSHLLTLWE